MPIPEFRYRFNADTNRWEVIQRPAGGADAVIADYETSGEAVEHVTRATDQPGKVEEPS
jgi:hypothetical protein